MINLNKKYYVTELDKTLQIVNADHRGLHACMRKTLLCSRIMGLLPLSGLNNQSSKDLKFQLKSPYTLLYAVSLVGQVLMFILSSCRLVHNGASLTNATNSLFYSSGILSSATLANLAMSWPKVVRKVEETELLLPPFKRNVARYCNLAASFILSAAIVEHLFSLYFGLAVARLCDEENIATSMFYYYMPWIFDYTPYHIWKGLLGEAFNLQSTLLWSYNDLLIMVISIYLTEHFNYHAQLLKNSLKHDHFLCDEFRMQYLKIVRLLKMINRKFGIYILTSFGTNLFWICIQLFYTLNKNQTGHFVACHRLFGLNRLRHSLEHSIYFTFSFTFVVTRTMLVLLLSARVHSASMKPLQMLYEIPTANFTTEVKRYIDQINNLKVALSGMDFFYVTRTMILSLFGTIVTYELVLLQFNK